MISILSKPAEEITASDIQELVETRVLESELIEFKQEPPRPNAETRPWPEALNNHAKNVLLEESVAFANAYGGALVLGIAEVDGAADSIWPIPNCAELAERLRLVFRNRVEPELPRVEIFSVDISDQSGVVVVRTSKSHRAPHRVTKTLVCPIRRADRCEPMTMREIQDMTLNVSRGLQRLDDRLNQRAAMFLREFQRLRSPDDAFGIRMTAIPVVDDVNVEPVVRQHELDTRLKPPSLTIARRQHDDEAPSNLRGIQATYGLNPSLWQPRLRAARAEDPNEWSGPPNEGSSYHAYRELHYDGLVETGFLSLRKTIYPGAEKEVPLHLHFELPVVEFATLVTWAHQIRVHAGTPTAEYAIDVQISASGRFGVRNIHSHHGFDLGFIEGGSTNFPRYQLGDPDNLPGLLLTFERDFWNAFRKEIRDSTQGTLEISAPELGA